MLGPGYPWSLLVIICQPHERFVWRLSSIDSYIEKDIVVSKTSHAARAIAGMDL